MTEPDLRLLTLTSEITSDHVSNNRVATGEVGALIGSVYEALTRLGAPEPEPAPEKPKGAVSIRASIKPDHLVSMIDGRSYKTLRRHITKHGYSPESYREMFGLPRDYPMVAASYAEHRRQLAHDIGLGRKRQPVEADEASDAAEVAPSPAKRPRRKSGARK